LITNFIERWDANRENAKVYFSKKENKPGSYLDLVKYVVGVIGSEEDEYGFGSTPDPNRIHVVDDGDYQGTLLFVIGASGYQPSDYWAVKVSYGSCSGCDTFQLIDLPYDYDDEPYVVSERAIDDLCTLCLHIVQGLKEI